FNLSAMLLDSDSEDDQPQQHHSQLDDIIMDGNQFFDAGRNEMFFSAGVEDIGAACRKVLLEGIQDLDYYDHTMFGKVDREDSTISDAVATMVEMGLDESDDESEVDYIQEDRGWRPHGSKAMFMLDLLENLPRLRLSDDQLKTIIWIMHECK
ncbi:hypothetical protein K438DRAFT_1520090, partial [Mycena galopus ATCC 62051]